MGISRADTPEKPDSPYSKYQRHVGRTKKDGANTRLKFLEELARTNSRRDALASVDRSDSWLYQTIRRHPDFGAAYAAANLRNTHLSLDGENKQGGKHTIEWEGNFDNFRAVFLDRVSPWFHIRLSDEVDRQEGGDIMLVIWPPEHGKTSMFEDRCTFDVATNPNVRITIGKEKKEFAEKMVMAVRNRLEQNLIDYWKLRERFGPFAPKLGRNAFGQQQTWSKDAFDVFKRRLGQERDFNMQALGINANVAGTRCDRLLIDDPQSRRSLNLTDKTLETMRDDWFSRPGVTGNTVILMNVVGDDDVGERLYNEGACDHVTILKAFDEEYLALGPRMHTDGELRASPWLWPERYTEKNYERLRRNAGPEGWARKYQQDWRPAITRTFTKEMWANCQNELRRLADGAPAHPGGGEAEVACSLDPSFKRTAVGAAAFEPTRMVVLDSYAQRNMRSTGQMIDLLAAEVRAFHVPGRSRVKWVIVETKGMQKGLITDDAFLELQREIGFEVLEQLTGWDKHSQDFGIAQMGRSMDRGEIDIPAGDDTSRLRFDDLRRELFDWRPEIKASNRGNVRKQDELMTLWFNWTRWHRLRRQSIKRGTPASSFGFTGIPLLPGQKLVVPAAGSSNWSFGKLPIRQTG